MDVFERDLKVGKTDNFTLTLSDNYLDGENVIALTVDVDSLVTLDAAEHDGKVLSAMLTGESVGLSKITFNWETATRTGCKTCCLIVNNSCD